MRSTLFIIPTVLIFHIAGAQTKTTSLTPSESTGTLSVSAASPTFVTEPVPTATSDAGAESAAGSVTGEVAILDYKSVYEAATLEEEVKMAAERFSLSADQKDTWMNAATDRRAAEKMAREKLDSKAASWERDGIYRGLRSAHNTFYETITIIK